MGDIQDTSPADHAISTFTCLISLLPETERDAFLRLSSSQIQSWAQTKLNEYQMYIDALKAVKNEAAPIHRLPTELLMKIFGNMYEDRDDIRFTHVCRKWRAVICGTPRFWAGGLNCGWSAIARREDPDGLQFLQLFMEHSAPHTIAPTLSGLSSATSDVLVPHAWRVTTLRLEELRTEDLLELHDLAASTVFPKLEELSLVPCKYVVERNLELYSDAFTPWPDEHFPRLRSLNAPGGFFSSVVAVKSLHSLSLTYGSAIRSLNVFLDALERASDLERLVLHATSIVDEFPFGPLGPKRTIPLPCLKHLSLSHEFLGQTPSFLNSLVFPSEAVVDIRVTTLTDFRSIFHAGPPSALAALLADQVQYEETGGHTVVSWETEHEKRLSISLASISHASVQQLVGYPIASHAVTHLSVRLLDPLHLVQNGDWVLFLQGLPQLTRLSVYGRHTRRMVMTLLGSAQSGVLVCPALEELILEWEITGTFEDSVVYEHDARARCHLVETALARRRTLGNSLRRLVFHDYVLPSGPSELHYTDLPVSTQDEMTEVLCGPLSQLADEVEVFLLEEIPSTEDQFDDDD